MRLFRQFILRRLGQDRARTATTIAGIALGIAVILAIQLANASSVRGFDTALSTVAGRTSIEIVGPSGIDETLLPSLGWLREMGTVAPVIEGEMAIVAGPVPFDSLPEAERGEARRTARRSEAVKVLGVDILRDRTVRDYVLGQPITQRFLTFLEEFLTFTVPAYVGEGKTRLTIAIGCTGGYHRSIAIGEALAAWLRGQDLGPVTIFHRELDRE